MKIYFELLGAAPENGALDQPLTTLRKWLERHLRIAVPDEARMVPLERLPLRFQGETDLDSFCRAAMKDFFNDRCQLAPRIRMQFGFAENRHLRAQQKPYRRILSRHFIPITWTPAVWNLIGGMKPRD